MIPCSGTIKASDINTELSRSYNYGFKIGNPEERQLAGKPYGLIKFSDFACKSAGFKMTIGSKSGQGSSYIGFSSRSGQFDTGLIEGQRPSPYFPAGFMGSSIGFYVFYCMSFSSNSNGRGLRVGFSSNGTDGVHCFGDNPVVTFTFQDGTIQSTQMSKYYNYYQGDFEPMRTLLSARVGQTCSVSVRA